MAGKIVIAVYRPKRGKEGDLRELIAAHVPVLRKHGLATDRPVMLFRAPSDGTHLEIFEWVAEESPRQAHDNPKVEAIWSAMGKVADFGLLSDLAEAGQRFPHFEPIDGVVS